MRKIEKDILRAVTQGYRINRGNTVYSPTTKEVRLHGNPVIHTGDKTFCMCGWGTTTTRSRLNAILPWLWQDHFDDVGVFQKRGAQMLVVRLNGAKHTIEIDTWTRYSAQDIMAAL